VRKPIWIAVLAAITLLPQDARSEEVPVEDFALIDHLGAFHQLSRYSNRKAVVLFVQGNGCPVTPKANETLQQLQKEYDDGVVKFLMLNANVDDDRISIKQEAEALEIDFPILHDETQLVAESLEIQQTGEVLLIDPDKKQLLYRGPIDNGLDRDLEPMPATQQYLKDALRAAVAGERLESEPTKGLALHTPGCKIAFPVRDRDRQTEVSYQKDIVPILQRRCVHCHQEGGIAPFAMASHLDVQGWSMMMRETILTKRMPPGQIDPEVGQFVDVHHITPQEQTTLIHWIDTGAQTTGDEDPLAMLGPQADVWELGEPDMVVDWPEVEVPATGVIDYFTNTVDMDALQEDRWVRAFEVKAGDKSVLHHCMISAQEIPAEGETRKRGSLMGFFVPGKSLTVYHEDVGYFLKAGSRLRLQLHYTTTGKVTVDRTKIGFYFRDSEPRMSIRQGLVANAGFVIPPNTENHPVSATYTVREDSYLFKLSPHMHNRGSYVDYSVVYPNGTSEKLISVPNYQFNWQMGYTLKEPKFLPKGAELVSNGGFNNSITNPYNPAPNEEVRYGDQTWEEMFNSWMSIAAVSKPEQPD
jgi:thiol-disulfide isomerase/thioredoxin